MQCVNQSFEIFTPKEDIEKYVKRVEKIARVCYKSEDKITDSSYQNFISMLIDKGHTAMLEHGQITVKITTDRGIANELIRHRHCSFAQESTRYCCYDKDKFGNEITVIDHETEWDEHLAIAYKLAEIEYLKLRRKGCPADIARNVLPIGLKTELVITANFREWMHILSLRTSHAAHPFVRRLCADILIEFKKIVPIIFDSIDCEGVYANV
jgi:thymidylate synthase (FAD)